MSIHKSKNARKHAKQSSCTVVNRRRGGGSLIENPVVFSSDLKYVYVNGGGVVKVFSVKTGECVRVLEYDMKYGAICGIFLHEDVLYTLTTKFFLLMLNPKSGILLKHMKLGCRFGTEVTRAYPMPSLTDSSTVDVCIVVKNVHDCILKCFSIDTGKHLRHPLDNIPVSDRQYSVSFGGCPKERIAACIHKYSLRVFALDGSASTPDLKPLRNNYWTSVCCHPREACVVAGDSLGRILVYWSPLVNTAAVAVYHWHTLPCNVIAFSPAGSTMFSGGEEHVLVKWNLVNPEIKNFLPRLPAPVVHISVSYDNTLVGVSLLDNSILLLDPSNKIQCVLHQMSWGIIPNPSTKLFSAGISYHGKTRSVVLNGKPGHLQFFTPENESFIFSMDITGQNYVSREREKEIFNSDVTATAVSEDSFWLATVETNKDPTISLNIKMKIWLFEPEKKRFIMHTLVDLPHDGEIHSMKFRPANDQSVDDVSADRLNNMLLTSGEDKRFRLWSPVLTDKKSLVWGCDRVGSFKNFPCGPCCFSEDGSLVAAAFQQSLTIWCSETFTLRSSLSKNSQLIKNVEFGRRTSCHLAVVTTSDELFVWNLLTLSVIWVVPLQVSILVPDPLSSFMAVFTDTKSMYVFEPASSQPVFSAQNMVRRNGDVLGAVFFPREYPVTCAPIWLQKSTLCYVDSFQELRCFETQTEGDEGLLVMVKEDEEPLSKFGTIMASNRTDLSQNSNPDALSSLKRTQYVVLGKEAIEQMLTSPAHTMPPMRSLCLSLLQSLSLSKKPHRETSIEEDDEEIEQEAMETEEHDSDEEDEVLKEEKPFKKPNFDDANITLTNLFKNDKDDLFFIDV